MRKVICRGKMTITAYQVDSVLNAYARQSKVRIKSSALQEDGSESPFKDIVSLSTKEANKAEALEKISYSLRDVILKDENL